ncbi:MAG TPA: winged helix-turn-helix domain-containing protein [Vicinamibacteria bacterium]
MPKTPAPHLYSFDDFTLDLDRGCLLHAGEEVKLRPKVFGALKYLVENSGRLVTKAELVDAVWSDAFVTDDSIVQCLVELRRALGDEAQRFVRTVPRRGYIFAAGVSPGTEREEEVKVAVAEALPTRSNRPIVIALTALAVAAVGAVLLYSRRPAAPAGAPALTDRDTVLIADFVNTTGDDVFDGTLRQALAVHLGQSPFLDIFSEERIRDTLRYMERPAGEPVTRDVAREIAQRQGVKAVLTGSIAPLGAHYVISLEAVDARTGDPIVREQTEAESREQVLRKLGEAASKLREKLGESLGSIEKFDAPLEQATTASLEALRAFSLGRQAHFSGRYFEAIPFYKRAVELDPDFAIAHAGLAITYGTAQEYGLAAEFAQQAFDLRERASERERFYISARYYMDVLRDSDKTIEVQELWKQTYPRDFVPRTNLAVRYCAIGQFARALEEAREAVRLRPDAGVGYASVALSLICLNRYDEARAAIEQAMARKLEPPHSRYMLYAVGFLHGDQAAMQEQLDRAVGTPIEAGMLAAESVTVASSGQLRKARELTDRAVDLARRRGLTEGAAQYAAGDALWEAAFGNCREAKQAAAKSLAIARSRYGLSWSALALALCGASDQAGRLADEMSSRFPHDTFFKTYWLPAIRAAVEIDRHPAQAVRLLKVALGGETGTHASLWPAYVRGLAYLRERAGSEATAEFQKILDHRGVLAPKDPNPAAYALYPLAHLGLARAAALTGDLDKSRKEYEELLALWKDADPDIPVLREARNEYRSARGARRQARDRRGAALTGWPRRSGRSNSPASS